MNLLKYLLILRFFTLYRSFQPVIDNYCKKLVLIPIWSVIVLIIGTLNLTICGSSLLDEASKARKANPRGMTPGQEELLRKLGKKDKKDFTKSIFGQVTDSKGTIIPNVKVFIKDVQNKTITVLITDQEGLYSIFGLDPKHDFQVYAEKGTLSSKSTTVSSFLNRSNNLINLKLISSGDKPAELKKAFIKKDVEISTEEGTKIQGDWYPPSSKYNNSTPAVLLLAGSGERRKVWHTFINEKLLNNDLGVLSIDLEEVNPSLVDRGSLVRNPKYSELSLMDIEAAIRWLISQELIDPFRIAIVGVDFGANLAFVASGKHENIRSAVMISGNLNETNQMVKDIPNFQPHSILYIATQGDKSSVSSVADFERQTGFPRQTQIFPGSKSRGSQVLIEIPEASRLVVEWLQKTLE